MKTIESLNLKVDSSEVVKATKAMDNLTAATERATRALRELGSLEHGGVSVEIVGSILVCEVKPAEKTAEADGSEEGL